MNATEKQVNYIQRLVNTQERFSLAEPGDESFPARRMNKVRQENMEAIKFFELAEIENDLDSKIASKLINTLKSFGDPMTIVEKLYDAELTQHFGTSAASYLEAMIDEQ